MGEPVSRLYAVGATIAIFEDDGAWAPVAADERLVRETGWRLRRLHDGLRVDAVPEHEPRCLLHRVRKRVDAADDGDVAWCMTHGDVGLGNVVVAPAGGGVRLIDFEEFHPGDPLADLVVGALEFACDAPGRAAAVVSWLLRGYVDSDPATSTYARWQHRPLRLALAEAALDEAVAWARWNWKTELAGRYLAGREAALAAIAALDR